MILIDLHHEDSNDVLVVAHENGIIESDPLYIYPEYSVKETFYPLCGNTVETEVYHYNEERVSKCKVQPNTYTRRTFYSEVREE